jgi:serine-type D-Ala-D-Ala carboxypeptidase (penicillin-binding protein 5/6)
MKKIFTYIILTLFIGVIINPIEVHAENTPPSVSADSAILLDANTGEILFSKNPDSAYPPASTTKIMTALLVFENANLNNYVTVGENPPKVDGTRLGLIEGEKIKVIDLLYAMLLASDNDCAEALAEYIGGSIDNFANMMNKRAKELGATHTNFVNPSGLFDNNHKTSANDLALIMKKLSENPEYSKIATTLYYKISPTNKSKETRTVWNENRLVQKNSTYYYKDAIGGKTGYTIQSFHSYVATATRDGHKLIVALVHDKKKTFFPDSIALFNYGFNNFKLEKLYSKGDIVTTYTKDNLSIPLIAASDFYYTKKVDSNSIPTLSLKKTNLSLKSFKKGDTVEQTTILVDGKSLGKLELISGTDYSPRTLFTTRLVEMLHIDPQYTPMLFCLFILVATAAVFVIKKRVSA